MLVSTTIVLATGLTRCKSRNPAAGTLDSAQSANTDKAGAPYETVNKVPQLSVYGNQFSFYWGIWRGLSPEEEEFMRNSPGQQASLVSRRSVVWELTDCASGALLHRDHEEFWYLDELQLENNALRPLREATRPGWRYFSMGSFDSTLARGAWGFPELTQRGGESNREFRERYAVERQVWTQNQSRKGQRGKVMLQSEHKFFPVAPSTIRSSFVSFFDYRADDANLLDGVYARYNPAWWPVHYDERAHKPHNIETPAIWRETETSVRGRAFNARLLWNWCDSGEKPVATFEVVPGEMPPPGPNRPGRTDAGNTTLPVADWAP
jgi:hypothetical protein